MAYNPGYLYPQYYQNYQYPAQPQPTAVQNVQNSGVTWVQGEAGAKSYLVAPNTTVALWDSEAQTIYLKSADPSGMPHMKILDYTVRGGQTMDQNVEYATKADLERLRQKIAEIRESLKGTDEE